MSFCVNRAKESAYVNYFILPILGTLMWTGESSRIESIERPFCFCFSATLGVSIKNLMRERERNVEQTMKIMGLNSTLNFICWLISSILPMVVVSLVVASNENNSMMTEKNIRFNFVFLLVVLKYGGIYPASDLSITIATLLALAVSALMLG